MVINDVLFMESANLIELAFPFTKKEIKKQYRKLVKEHHPDKGGDPDLFRQMKEAYDYLSSEVQQYSDSERFEKFDQKSYRLNLTKYAFSYTMRE